MGVAASGIDSKTLGGEGFTSVQITLLQDVRRLINITELSHRDNSRTGKLYVHGNFLNTPLNVTVMCLPNSQLKEFLYSKNSSKFIIILTHTHPHIRREEIGTNFLAVLSLCIYIILCKHKDKNCTRLFLTSCLLKGLTIIKLGLWMY